MVPATLRASWMLMPRRRLGDSDVEVSVLSLGSWLTFANKLWFEFWPEQNANGELDASLQRLGFDYLDLEYCAPLPASLPVAEAVQEVGGLIRSGKLRAWGVLNWSGKYTRPEAGGRVADQLDSPRYRGALSVAPKLEAVAVRFGQPPAAVAIAYALANPLVASVLFGATTPEQVHENCQALAASEQLSASVVDELHALT